MATLSIWDTTHHKVIHGMVWQVEPDRFKLDDPQSVIGKFQRNDLTEDRLNKLEPGGLFRTTLYLSLAL